MTDESPVGADPRARPRLGLAVVGLAVALWVSSTVGPLAGGGPLGGDNAAHAAEPATGAHLAQDDDEGGQDETAVGGTLRGGGETLDGVTISVTTADGKPVGEATTGEDGTWEVAIPQPGTYVVSIAADTLPQDLSVREPDRFASQQVEVAGGESAAVLFPIVAGGAEGSSFEGLREFVSLLVSGLQLGAVIAITSLGLSLIFGTTGLINFAHGEMVTFGAVAAFFFNRPGGLVNIHVIPAALLAMLLGAGLGWGMERGLFAPLRRRSTSLITLLVISIGLSIVLRYAILAVYGGLANPYRNYAAQQPLELGPITTTPLDLVVTGLALAVLVAVGLLLTRTKLGTAIRAVADNRDLAESSGIDVQRVILAVWVSGGALAAFGGVAQGLTQSITWDMGFKLLLLMFAGVILGGLGTAFGAMVGGLVVGVAVQVSTLWFSVELKQVFAFGLLILVLLVRPQGILGRRQRIG
jgi:branched-chain amino acid transport system permease protein